MIKGWTDGYLQLKTGPFIKSSGASLMHSCQLPFLLKKKDEKPIFFALLTLPCVYFLLTPHDLTLCISFLGLLSEIITNLA